MKLSAVAEVTLVASILVLSTLSSRHNFKVLGVDTPSFAILMSLVLAYTLPMRDVFPQRTLAKRASGVFVFILAYALLTVILHSYTVGDTHSLVLPVVMALLAMAVPYKLTGLIESIGACPQKIIFRFSVIVTLTTALYAVSLQIQGTAAARLSTPLGGAADIHVGLLLTLAGYFACAKSGYRRTYSLWLAVLTIGIIFTTGSRAGVVTALLLGGLMVLDARRLTRSIVVALTVGGVFFAAYHLFPNARLTDTVDLSRTTNTDTAFGILHNASPVDLICGMGSGSVWPWYAYENSGFRFDETTGIVHTQYGDLLTNPHSVPLGVVVELGLIGLGALAMLLAILIAGYWKARRAAERSEFVEILYYGIFCSLPAFMYDYYLFKSFPVSFIWWYFVFVALTLSGLLDDASSPRRSVRKRHVHTPSGRGPLASLPSGRALLRAPFRGT